MDVNKFMDLEATMRMLYDHGNMKFDQSLDEIPTTNASMREPKRTALPVKGKKPEKQPTVVATPSVTATGKRQKRPAETVPAKPPQKAKDKPAK